MTATKEAITPIHDLSAIPGRTGPEEGAALCLSGGGYRAMVFHVGVILRLNELKILKTLNRISSVSGGSITAGVLGMNWRQLNFVDGQAVNLPDMLVNPIRALAAKSIDSSSVIAGGLSPFSTVSEQVAEHYDKILFHGKTLQDLPSDAEGPRFVINATNVQTGSLFRFSKPYLADYQLGVVENPTVKLSVAVAASSAFPPILSPAKLELPDGAFKKDDTLALQRKPYTTDIVLSDGGVYDNLGLETAWKRYKTILVSDAGAKIAAEAEPKEDWARHAYRVLDLVDNQVRSLRKRQLIASYEAKQDGHDGAYWGIRTDIADYKIGNALNCPFAKTLLLANIPTRLKEMDIATQNQLMNWGYAVCDAAIRCHIPPNQPCAPNFPFPGEVG